MTSVVGILNKRGIAIAADSAVTRNRRKENGFGTQRITKCTKNGNKMVRLSNAVPITVMFTGNAEYLDTPWDVIARRYRQQRGGIAHATVEDAVNDFFRFISENPVFWTESSTGYFMHCLIENTFERLAGDMSDEDERTEEGKMIRPAAFRKAFIKNVRSLKLLAASRGECPQFADCSIEAFRSSIGDILESFLNSKAYPEDGLFMYDAYPKEVLDAIRPSFEEALLAVISSRMEDGPSAELIFSGFGADQEYPSLSPVTVCGGYDFRVNYNYRKEDIVCISDERPVAICPFAQDDVIKSILRGIHRDWSAEVCDTLEQMIHPCTNSIFQPFMDEEMPDDFVLQLCDVPIDDLTEKFRREGIRMLDNTQREWEKALRNYDLEEMAALADSLIDLTGFQRILTFSQEGVGGTVDLAVISKADGFTWIRRKNWYHKDNGLSI